MRPAWRNPRGLRARSIGDNMFVGDFANKMDRDQALEGSSWMVGRRAILLQGYNANMRPTDIRFDSMSIWVHILDIPVGWMNIMKGWKIASLIDKPRFLASSSRLLKVHVYMFVFLV